MFSKQEFAIISNLIFISAAGKNFMLSWVEHENGFKTRGLELWSVAWTSHV